MDKKEHSLQFKTWNHSSDSDLNFCEGRYIDFKFPPHFHEHYVIQIVEYGIIEWSCQRRNIKTEPGIISIINPGEIHTGSSYEEKPLYYKSIRPELRHLQDILAILDLPNNKTPEFTSIHISHPSLLQKIKELTTFSTQEHDILQFDSLLIEFFLQLFEQHSNIKCPSNSMRYQDNQKISRAISFIKENFDRQFTLEELSLFCQAEACYLIKLFKKRVGLTPYQYLRNYRIEIAKKKLQQNIALSQVALEVGFFDQSHFHRNFKPLTGMTPFQYKRQFCTRFGA